MNDHSVFPHTVYKDTVLAPLFEGAKRHFVEPVRDINRAHLVMLCETGILDRSLSQIIAKALADIDRTVDIESLEYTGEFEDYFFLVESELKDRLGIDVAGQLHTARSRNDMDHTVFKMVLRRSTDDLLTLSHALVKTLISRIATERDTLIVAYTHGQPAQPTTFGHYLAAVLEVLLRDLERLHSARGLLDHCPMGAAAITTSGFQIDRERVAELLGFDSILRNSYGCIASVDYVTGLYSAIKLMMLHLGRVIQDMQFWTAFEVGQLYVPNELVQISSIMPQKRNPVPIEHLRHLASMTCGHCDSIVQTMHNTPFTDMNDSEGEVQQAGYAAFASGGRVLSLMAALLDAVSIEQQRVAKNIDASCITITELADTLVRSEKLSFRHAHEIAATTAKAVIEKGLPLRSGFVAFSDSFSELTGRKSVMTEPEFIVAVSAENFVAIRSRPGGPAPSAMDEALDQYKQEFDSFVTQLRTSRQRTVDGTKLLTAEFEKLLGDR